MKKSKDLTNVVVCHDGAEPENIIESCEFCNVVQLVMREKFPFDYNSANQISETRGFLQLRPREIDTRFVSFVSYRISQKTKKNIDLHSACKFVKVMKTHEVIAPFTIRNSVSRMLNPDQDAPNYANWASEVYKTLFEHSPMIRSMINKSDLDAEQVFPFCNSFVMSKKTYKRFHRHLRRNVKRIWHETGFNASWGESFSAEFPGREFGMLFERFTALWFGLDQSLEIYSNGWGEKYPSEIPNEQMQINDWRSQNGSMELAKSPASQYN
jgi:hypothetical protein